MNGRLAIDDDAAVARQGMAGTLYCGDNLEVLTEYIPDESVDLIYLDPPFNSKRTYNIVYKDSRAQAEAFKDHWAWEEVAGDYERFVGDAKAPARLRKLMRALHEQLIDEDSDLLAYLTMMAPRLAGLHPIYVARQLHLFKDGGRSGPDAPLMTKPVAALTNDDILNISAYLGSLPPN